MVEINGISAMFPDGLVPNASVFGGAGLISAALLSFSDSAQATTY